MENDRPSRTAEHVAALRGLGVLLPPRVRLVDDPFGAEWTGWGWLRRLSAAMPAAAQLMAFPMWRWLLYMQVRTFALDREVARFAESGGRQLILLGAGLDARALRLRHLGLRVFEIDHPATQERKKRLVRSGSEGGDTTFVAWDFEHDPLTALTQRLGDVGYRRNEAGCVVWEGVTMYLSEAANAAVFDMLADLLAPGSVVAFTYFARDFLAAPGWRDRSMRKFVARHGEPWIFGWEPDQLPSWLAARGFALEHDDSTAALAGLWLPPEFAARLKEGQRRIALARRAAAQRANAATLSGLRLQQVGAVHDLAGADVIGRLAEGRRSSGAGSPADGTTPGFDGPAPGFGSLGFEPMHTILITGFGRFPGSPVNPSGIVAARLARRRRPALAATRRVGHVFATRYDAVDRELPVLLARERPGILVMFGVATRSREVRVEERARNRVALFPDAGRKRPPMQTIAPGCDARRNPLPLARLVTAARATGVAATRSRNAGSYLCNYVYWRGLEAAAQSGGPDVVIFVHVPPVALKKMPKKAGGADARRAPRHGKRAPVRPADRRRRAPGVDELVRAGEAIVLAMTALAPKRPPPAGSPPSARIGPADQRPERIY